MLSGDRNALCVGIFVLSGKIPRRKAHMAWGDGWPCVPVAEQYHHSVYRHVDCPDRKAAL